MSKITNEINWNWTDIDLMIAISRCQKNPLDVTEILNNLFYFEKQVMCYTFFVRSLRKLAVIEMIKVKEGKLVANRDSIAELKNYKIPLTSKNFYHGDMIDSFNINHPITKGKLEEYPKRIISVFEYEEAIEKFYAFIIRYVPAHVIPRSFDKDKLQIDGYSQDPTYGYSVDNPIKVGGFNLVGTQCIRMYLDSINGYDNEPITHKRIAASKMIDSPNGRNGNAIIDKYALWYKDETEPQHLYFNMYDCELPLKAPLGFVIKEPNYLNY